MNKQTKPEPFKPPTKRTSQLAIGSKAWIAAAAWEADPVAAETNAKAAALAAWEKKKLSETLGAGVAPLNPAKHRLKI